MAGKNTNIDSLFKDGLKDTKVAPPKEVWKHVSQALEQKKSRRMVWMFSRVAAAIVVLISGLVIYFMVFSFMKTENNTPEISEAITSEKKAENTTHNNPMPEDTQEKTIHIPSADIENDNAVSEEASSQAEKNRESSGALKKTTIETNAKDDAVETENMGMHQMVLAEKEQVMEPVSNISSVKMKPNGLKSMNRIYPKKLEMEMPEAKPVSSSNKKPIYYASLPKPKQVDKWQLGAFYAPLYSYRMVESADVSSVQNQIIQNSETGMVTYAGGLSVTYRASRRLKISSGINVTKMGNSIENIVAYVSHYDYEGYYAGGGRTKKVSYQVNNSMGSIQTAEPNAEINTDPSRLDLFSFVGSDMNSLNTAIISNSSEIIQDFTYIELPVLMKYSIIESKIDLNLLTGLSSFLMLDNEVIFKNYGGNDVRGRTNNVKSTNFSGSVGLGLAYDITGTVQVYLDPVFKLFLNSINTSSSIDTYPYSFGLYSGISFVF